jgi:molybdate transport system substrate-binding protein
LLGNGRLATADPAHVPLGRYAQAALQSLGAWPTVAPRLAPAENARAALVLVERGEAPFAILYGSDARDAPRIAVVATFPADSHPAIAYHFALVASRAGGGAASAFLAYLVGPQAAPVYRRLGFLLRE